MEGCTPLKPISPARASRLASLSEHAHRLLTPEEVDGIKAIAPDFDTVHDKCFVMSGTNAGQIGYIWGKCDNRLIVQVEDGSFYTMPVSHVAVSK